MKPSKETYMRARKLWQFSPHAARTVLLEEATPAEARIILTKWAVQA
jgi:hypothetical protein